MCIDILFEEISAAIARGERVELRGFGTFFSRDVQARKSVNTIPAFSNIPAHKRVIFRPCQKLRVSAWNRVARQNEQQPKVEVDES